MTTLFLECKDSLIAWRYGTLQGVAFKVGSITLGVISSWYAMFFYSSNKVTRWQVLLPCLGFGIFIVVMVGF